ncbi:ROK family protein [Candidatus Bipolaricaulota bacterium]|nr:ROK family protein [Candidatus Bipolaricaulota bacterium]
MTRRALGTELGLSRPTIERALRSLANKELIASSELNTPNRGRPATVFQVRENAWLTLGMDFELPEVNLVLANTVGTILHQKQFEVRQDLNDPRRVLDRLADTILEWLDGSAGSSIERIAGLGIGVPGFLTPNGVSFVGRNLPNWEQVPVKEYLEERLHLPVLIQHDVHLMALAEIEHRRWSRGIVLFVIVRPGLNDDLRIGAAIGMAGRVFVGGHGNGGALYQAVVEAKELEGLSGEARVHQIAGRLAASLTHAIPLIDPNHIVIHAECLGKDERTLIEYCREALVESMRGEYIGVGELVAAAIRGASGAQQAAVSVSRQLLLQPVAIAGMSGGEGQVTHRIDRNGADSLGVVE